MYIIIWTKPNINTYSSSGTKTFRKYKRTADKVDAIIVVWKEETTALLRGEEPRL